MNEEHPGLPPKTMKDKIRPGTIVVFALLALAVLTQVVVVFAYHGPK